MDFSTRTERLILDDLTCEDFTGIQRIARDPVLRDARRGV